MSDKIDGYEAEAYCYCCGDFRDLELHGADIVCPECHWIIATFRVRPVITNGYTTPAIVVGSIVAQEMGKPKL